ncbi:MAG TPA: hypothetical protein VIO87_00895 [Methylotenera sp.]|jgi:hypothetical protein
MSKMILLPDGNAVSNEVVRSVTYYEGKGVMCRDAQARTVCYIKEADVETGRRIRNLLIKVVNDGKAAEQPDWSFIKQGTN